MSGIAHAGGFALKSTTCQEYPALALRNVCDIETRVLAGTTSFQKKCVRFWMQAVKAEEL